MCCCLQGCLDMLGEHEQSILLWQPSPHAQILPFRAFGAQNGPQVSPCFGSQCLTWVAPCNNDSHISRFGSCGLLVLHCNSCQICDSAVFALLSKACFVVSNGHAMNLSCLCVSLPHLLHVSQGLLRHISASTGRCSCSIHQHKAKTNNIRHQQVTHPYRYATPPPAHVYVPDVAIPGREAAVFRSLDDAHAPRPEHSEIIHSNGAAGLLMRFSRPAMVPDALHALVPSSRPDLLGKSL